MIRLLLIGTLAFGAATASAQENAQEPAPKGEQADTPPAITAGGDPLALIAAIYEAYEADRVNIDHVFSRRLQGLLDDDAKKTPEGDVGTIDWDVFVNGNNFEISKVKVALLAKSAVRARVRARFDNMKKPQEITFDLVLEDGAWHIDEVSSTRKDERWTMSKILGGAPDAFPDRKE